MINIFEQFDDYYKSLEEKFSDDRTRAHHYDRHGQEFIPPFDTPEEYEEYADQFVTNELKAKSAFDEEADWVGYIDKDNRRYLYNRPSRAEVIYKYDGRFKEPTIISFYRAKPGMFEKLRDYPDRENDYTFFKELPHVQREQEAQKAIEQQAADKERKENEKAKKRDKYNKKIQRQKGKH